MFAGYKTTRKSPQKFNVSNASSANIPGTPLVGVTAQTFLESQKAKAEKDSDSVKPASPHTTPPKQPRKKKAKLVDVL